VLAPEEQNIYRKKKSMMIVVRGTSWKRVLTYFRTKKHLSSKK